MLKDMSHDVDADVPLKVVPRLRRVGLWAAVEATKQGS